MWPYQTCVHVSVGGREEGPHVSDVGHVGSEGAVDETSHVLPTYRSRGQIKAKTH